MKSFLLTCSVFFLLNHLSGQITVTGIVSNAAGEPLIGVNISEKGTIKGTVTDFHGMYRIETN